MPHAIVSARGQRTDTHHPVHEDAVPRHEEVDFLQHLAHFDERLPHLGVEPFRQIGLDPPDATVRDGQARAGHVFDELPQELASLDHVEEHGEGAELHGAGADARQVVAEPRDLAHDHADVRAPFGDLDAEELFDRRRVAEIVDEG
jgi:hypothetical protein